MLQIIAVAIDAGFELSSAIQRLEHKAIATYKDLKLLSAVVIAHFIVWRELRRRAKSITH